MGSSSTSTDSSGGLSDNTLTAPSTDTEPTTAGDAPSNSNVSTTTSEVETSALTRSEDGEATGECGLRVNLELGKIATVGVLTFTTNLPSLDSANVEFALADGGPTMVAPVNLAADGHKTFLLGMKQGRDYEVRLIANSGELTCTSEEQTLTTGTLSIAPEIIIEGSGGTRGFVVAGDGAIIDSKGIVFIFDTDGDIVWAHEGPQQAARVRLDWEAQYVWSMAINQSAGQARADRVSVDGEVVEVDIPALARETHDFTVLPNGHVAVLSLGADDSVPMAERPCGQVLDYDPVSKIAKPIVADLASLYASTNDNCHPNALTYQQQTNTFIISDLNLDGFVKFSAIDGKPIWQLGGVDPVAPKLTGDGHDWQITHGHHLTPEGRFVFFNNVGPAEDDKSVIRELQIDEAGGSATAGPILSDGLLSTFLGDVQVLRNGNLWVTYSASATMREYDTTGVALVTYRVIGGGYSYFMESLYDKPVNK